MSKAEILRLIYQGRFLHCNVTLGALGLPLGKTTVMHLVPRDNLPEPNSQGRFSKKKKKKKYGFNYKELLKFKFAMHTKNILLNFPPLLDQRQNSKGGSGRCCSTNCSIL